MALCRRLGLGLGWLVGCGLQCNTADKGAPRWVLMLFAVGRVVVVLGPTCNHNRRLNGLPAVGWATPPWEWILVVCGGGMLRGEP